MTCLAEGQALDGKIDLKLTALVRAFSVPVWTANATRFSSRIKWRQAGSLLRSSGRRAALAALHPDQPIGISAMAHPP